MTNPNYPQGPGGQPEYGAQPGNFDAQGQQYEGYYQNTTPGGQEQYADYTSVPPPSRPFPAGYLPNGALVGVGPVRPKVGFVDSIKLFYRNYATFYGRASRSEYWWSYLYLTLAFFALFTLYMIFLVLSSMAGSNSAGVWTVLAGVFGFAFSIFGLGNIVPIYSVTVRRIHDAGYSGWFVLIGIVSFIFSLLPSNPEGVKYDNPDGSQPAIPHPEQTMQPQNQY